MTLKIKANSFATQRYLEVDSAGVTFCETALMGGRRRFQFRQIDLILLSPGNELSMQVGQEVFKLPINPSDPVHRQTVEALLQGVRRSAVE